MTSVRHLDRGAWLSVNGNREFGISNLWSLARSDFCDCRITDFLAEGFVEIGVDPPTVDARFAGRCISCGTEGTTDWVTLGRVIDPDSGDFLSVDSDSVHVPERRTRLSRPQ